MRFRFERRLLHESLESRRLLAASPQLIHEDVPFCRVEAQSSKSAVAYISVTRECGINNGGPKLWRTDGTSEGTFDLGGAGADWVGSVFESGDDIFWTIGHSQDPGEGFLYRSDGSESSAVEISRESTLYEVNEHILFVPALSNELRRITDNGSETLNRFESMTRIFVDGDVGIFWANNQIWRTDGTAEGTQAVRELSFDATEFSFETRVHISELGLGGVIMVGKRNGVEEIWVTDGTAEGTRHLDTPHLPTTYTVGGLHLLWPTDEQDLTLRVTDGDTITTIAELDSMQFAWHAEEVDGLLYLAVGSGQIWVTDGTPRRHASPCRVVLADSYILVSIK